MIHRNWRTYQEALAAHNAAKAQHETAVQRWNQKVASFDKDLDQAEGVSGQRMFPLDEGFGMKRCTRRQMLRTTSLIVSTLALRSGDVWSAAEGNDPSGRGAIAGEASAARIGQKILDSGGTAIDAILSAALVAAVVSPHNCGIGGYGGHMILALAKPRKIVSIDFNSAAPALAKPEMFPLDSKGRAQGRSNELGWLAAGVPGVLAGIELAARKYASRSFRELLAPAIELAEEGFVAGKRIESVVRANAAQLKKDPASAALYFVDGRLPGADDLIRNRDLAGLLRLLAKENSVEPFYRGAIARTIADAFHAHGGLVTADDLARYEAVEVEPYELRWNDHTVYTAPLTAGGLTTLEALHILQALDRRTLNRDESNHARIDALRLAWSDRLTLLGDPRFVRAPLDWLLSKEHADRQARTVLKALKEKQPVPLSFDIPPDHGTVNLSCGDAAGNLVALTLTHGDSFGAQVTVPKLGLTLGHGMSRFDPRPDQPNSVAAGKRPLHNMCPTIVARNGTPVLAIGAAGGRKIPNAIFDVLLNYLGNGGSPEAALAAPRCHTEGDRRLILEASLPSAEASYLQSIGYETKTGASAFVSYAMFDPAHAQCRAAAR